MGEDVAMSMSPVAKTKQGRRCRVWGCVNQKKEPASETRLFRIPKMGPEMFEKWVQATGNVEFLEVPIIHLKANLHYCDLHFLPEDLVEPKRVRLKRGVVPTLFAENHTPLSDKQMQQWRKEKHYSALIENTPAIADLSQKNSMHKPAVKTNRMHEPALRDIINTDGSQHSYSPSNSPTTNQVVSTGNSGGTQLHPLRIPDNTGLVFVPVIDGGKVAYKACYSLETTATDPSVPETRSASSSPAVMHKPSVVTNTMHKPAVQDVSNTDGSQHNFSAPNTATTEQGPVGGTPSQVLVCQFGNYLFAFTGPAVELGTVA